MYPSWINFGFPLVEITNSMGPLVMTWGWAAGVVEVEGGVEACVGGGVGCGAEWRVGSAGRDTVNVCLSEAEICGRIVWEGVNKFALLSLMDGPKYGNYNRKSRQKSIIVTLIISVLELASWMIAFKIFTLYIPITLKWPNRFTVSCTALCGFTIQESNKMLSWANLELKGFVKQTQ